VLARRGRAILGAAAGSLLLAGLAYRLWGGVRQPLRPVPVELPGQERISFLAVGRQGYGNPWASEVAAGMERSAAEEATHFVVLTGDNFYPSGVASVTDAQWQEKFEVLYGGPRLGTLPFYAVLGNHDHQGNAAAQLQYAREQRGSGRFRMDGFSYYRDFGRVGDRILLRMVFLDTVPMIERWGAKRAAVSFLREALVLPGDPVWRVVVGHSGVRSLTRNPFTSQLLLDDLLGVMQELEVDLVLSGNDRFQQVLDEPGEPLHVSSNGGGRKLETGIAERSTESAFVAVRPGFARVTVDAASLEVSMFDRQGNATYRKVRRR